MALYIENKGKDLESVYKEAFLDECLGSQCDDAVENLVSSINGNPGVFGCDLQDILYQGDVNGNYYQGWRDQIVSKAAYIYVLISIGVIVVSAYSTIKTGNHKAW